MDIKQRLCDQRQVKSMPLTLRVPLDMRERLKRAAKAYGTPVSKLIKAYIIEGLDYSEAQTKLIYPEDDRDPADIPQMFQTQTGISIPGPTPRQLEDMEREAQKRKDIENEMRMLSGQDTI